MWHWDQGHLPYFQFDALRQIAKFVELHDFMVAGQNELFEATGLTFARPANYTPWRNYARVLRSCLLVSKRNDQAVPTAVARLLCQPGIVTADEYFHFLARATTEPSPAFQDWQPNANFKYPLLFSLKYLLAKAAIARQTSSTLDEIVGAFRECGLTGAEKDVEFIEVINRRNARDYHQSGQTAPDNLRRQARESLRVIAQISYLHIQNNDIFVSLSSGDAHNIFFELDPIIGPRADERDAEIRRLADLFQDGFTDIRFDFPETVVEDVVESGFREGSKVKRTHLTIERNSGIRREFFLVRPTSICDVCRLNTQIMYPWTERIIDLHHLLPLSSGTRVEVNGTTLDDLVPVCPTCHRAVHRYYDLWLRNENKQDFVNTDEARRIYSQMKAEFPGARYA